MPLKYTVVHSLFVSTVHGSAYPPYLAVDLVTENGHPGAVGVAPDGPDDAETFARLRTRERSSVAQRSNLSRARMQGMKQGGAAV